MQSTFFKKLSANSDLLKRLLHLPDNTDIVIRPFRSMGLDCALYYVDGLTGTAWAADYILRPMMECTDPHSGDDAIQTAARTLIATPEVKTETGVSAAIDALMHGMCMILLDGVSTALLVDSRMYVKRSVSTPQTETVVIGPHEAFTEPLRDNLTLMHRILPTENLICKMLAVGRQVSTKVSLCYIEGICPQETVDEITRRLDACAVSDIQTSGMLSQLLEDDPFAPLPSILSTERPDRAASFLLEGQAVLLMDGSPRALAMPISLWHLFHAPDDSYMRWQYGSFMRIIRIIGAALALFLPAVFVSIVTFHPIALPMSLLTNIIQSRSVISISLFAEAILMLTVFDLINEAGTRIPGLLGSSFGLVSALILGTAAVDAGMVSPLLLIVVALSGLGSYALPDYSLSFAFRMGQMLLLIAGGLMGLPGVCLVTVAIIMRTAGMTSLGRPYLAPSTPKRTHNPDLVMRGPVYRQRLRGYLANPLRMQRARGRMRK